MCLETNAGAKFQEKLSRVKLCITANRAKRTLRRLALEVDIRGMVRPLKPRRVLFDPDVVYFKPRAVPLSMLEEVDLGIDELEALRLCDYKNLEQTEAAKKMKISQSTLQRILTSARRKVAEALTSGKAIKIKKS